MIRRIKEEKDQSFVLFIMSEGNPSLSVSHGGYKNQMRLFLQKLTVNCEVLNSDYYFQNGVLILESQHNIAEGLKLKKSHTNEFKISTGILILNRKPPQCNIQKTVFEFSSFPSEKSKSLVPGKPLGYLDFEIL